MTSKGPQFSVVIPALNEEKYLPKLLADLNNQTVNNFEIIVVDGHSDDKTVKKVGDFPEVTLINSDKRNVSYQRNLGANLAKGEWIIFMDADNRLPNYFMEGITYRLKLNDPDSFTCWLLADSKKKDDEAIANFLNTGIELIKMFNSPGAMGALIGVKKRVFAKAGGFDENVRFGEDWQFIKKVFERGFSFEIFKDPRFICSLRRFRREGKLGSLRNLAKIYAKQLTGREIKTEDYPMGGKVSTGDTPIIRRIKQVIRKLSKKPDFIKKLRTLLDNTEANT